jgi:hypothetical protein
MCDEHITVYRAGSFATEPHPPWRREIRRIAEERRDWNASVRAVLDETSAHVIIGDEYWPFGELRAHRTPEGGQYVELNEGESTFAEVWVPDPADWLVFNACYVEPFLLTRATLYQADRLDRLGNALIAFARHGEGKHIERETGESRIDQREDWEHRKRERREQRVVAAPHAAAAPRAVAAVATPIVASD